VIGFSQLIMEGEVPEEIKEDLGIIASEAQRAAKIVKKPPDLCPQTSTCKAVEPGE